MKTTDTQSNAPTLHWGERTELLEKHLAYVFSLDLGYEIVPEQGHRILTGARIPIEVQSPKNGFSTYHVLDDDLVHTADGVVREVPLARVVRGNDLFSLDDSGVANLDGKLLLESDAGASIWLEYGGTVRIAGLRTRIENLIRMDQTGELLGARELRGLAHVAARFESSQTKFRWLVQNQLVGFGKAVLTSPAPRLPGGKPSNWSVTLSFDLYSAG